MRLLHARMVAAHGLPTETELRSLVPWARGYLCAKFGLNAVSLAETTLARAAETAGAEVVATVGQG